MRNQVNCWILLISVFLSVGCSTTHEREDDYDPVELTRVERHHVPVELRLTEEFKNHVYVMSLADTFTFEMGRTLQENAKRVAAATFQVPTPDAPARGVLTPRVVSVDDLWSGTTTFADASLSVEIEWRLEDPQGNLLWLGTETGVAVSDRGVWVKSAAAKRLQLALDEVFQKSATSISTASAIRDWAGD